MIEAEYVRSDDTHVTLRMNDREFTFALDKLSEEDREFVASRKEESASGGVDAKTGWLDHVEINHPAFPDVKGYLESANAKAVYKAFESGNFPQTWKANRGTIEEMFSYEDGAMIVYVPEDYGPAKPPGVYLHISPGDGGEGIRDYIPVMDGLSLIYVSPKGTSNNQPMLRRVKLAVDALATVKEQWQIDEQRVVVGGLSGGGHIAMLTHAMFPEWFRGSVSHAAQSYLPSGQSVGHFPGLTERDLTGREFKDHKWVVVSGNKDFNYQEILKSGEVWKDSRAEYRFIDVPDMGHTNAPPQALEEALKWIGL